MDITGKKAVIDNDELLDDEIIGELDFIDDLEEIEKEEEEENMGHRRMTSDPEMDGDGDYLFNEKYFEQ